MAFEQQGFDIDFQFEFVDQNFLHFPEVEDREKAVNSGWSGVDSLFESESNNPLFGNDLSLASALNYSSDDDLLACAPTDVFSQVEESPKVQQEPVVKVKGVQVNQSPCHESDSGMSDTTPSSSPQRAFQDNHVVVGSTRRPALQNVDLLNVDVDDLDFDFDQYSPSSSCTTSPSHSIQDSNINDKSTVSLVDEFFVEADKRHKKALEFFDADSDKHQTLKLVPVQQEVPEERSRKNAIQAKINREKKKAYIKSLEDEITSLQVDNKKFKSQNERMQSNMSALEEEVEYLKSVLVNSSSLSSLLKNISNVNEVKLSATVLGRKRSVTDDHSYNFVESVPEKRARRINENLKKAGVCLHVNGGSACLEFCAHCSKLAQKSSLI